MAKKKRKSQKLNIFFSIAIILSPLIILLAISLVKYFRTGVFDFAPALTHTFEALKNFKEFFIPSVILLAILLLVVVISKFISKKLPTVAWIILIIVGSLFIMLGNRLLFVSLNGLWRGDVVSFFKNGISPYAFAISLELSLLICWICYYFDTKYLKK